MNNLITGHLDVSGDFDELTLDHERLARNYRDSMTVRASLVAHYLGTVLPDPESSVGIDLSSMCRSEPVGL